MRTSKKLPEIHYPGFQDTFAQKIAFSGLILSEKPEIQEKFRETGWLVDVEESTAGQRDHAALHTPLLLPLPELVAQVPEGIVLSCHGGSNVDYVLRCLEEGIAVYLLSPFCYTSAELDRMVTTARTHNVPIDVDFPLRYSCYQLAHTEVRSGSLGTIRLVHITVPHPEAEPIRYSPDPQLSFGQCPLLPAPHLLDLALWSLENPAVTPLPSDCEKELLFETETGTLIQLSRQQQPEATGNCGLLQIRFQGSAGEIEFGNNENCSPYHFEIFHSNRHGRNCLFNGNDHWAGRSFLEWRRKVSLGLGYEDRIESLLPELALFSRFGEPAPSETGFGMPVS